MSKVKFFLSLAIPLFLMVGVARADVLVFPDIDATEKALRHNTWMTDDGVQSRLLAQVACQSTTGKNVVSKYPKLYQSDGACVDLFLARNNIKSTVISVDEYRAKAKGGWWLPTNSDVTSNGEEVQVIAKQLATTQQRVDQLEKGGQAAIVALKSETQGQLAAVKQQAETAKAQSANATTAVRKLDTKLNGVNKQLEELAPVAATVNKTTADIADINQRLGEVAGNTAALTGTVSTLTDTVGKTNGRWWIYALGLAAFVGVTLVVFGLRQSRLQKSVDDRFKKQTHRVNDLKQIVTGSALDDSDEVGGLMATTNRLIEGQEATDEKLKEHEEKQQQLGEQVQQLGEQVQKLTEQQLHDGDEVDRLRQHAAQTNRMSLYLAQAVDDALVLAESTTSVMFDRANPGLDVLENLPVGKEHAVTWKGKYNNGHFTVNIWREETTPKGLVETNVVRCQETGQVSRPMALKRLRQRIGAAVADGRVPVVKLLASAA